MSDKATLCFIDSNIWLYAFIKDLEQPQKSEIAKKIVSVTNILISTQVINEVAVTRTPRATHYRGAAPQGGRSSSQGIRPVRRLTTTCDSSSRARLEAFASPSEPAVADDGA